MSEVVIYGAGENATYEELGAIELLRNNGIRVKVVLHPQSDEADLFSAKIVLSHFGVDVCVFNPGEFGKHRCVVCFGRTDMFDLIRKFSDKPGKVVYGIPNTGFSNQEVRANKEGLIDEVFVKSRTKGPEIAKQLVKKSNHGVCFRVGYTPFCSPHSDFFKIKFYDKKPADCFNVLRDTIDRTDYCFADHWLMVSKISCPFPKSKMFTALNWGRNLSKVAGNPCDSRNMWNNLLDVTVVPPSTPFDIEREKYAAASSLLHFFPAEEHFSFSAAKAILSGAVVVSNPLPAYVELLDHGVSGFISKTSEEAGYYTSKLAWEPFLRLKIATEAYGWFVTHGPGNPDRCFEWWKGLL
jgi:hypothetical protein